MQIIDQRIAATFIWLTMSRKTIAQTKTKDKIPTVDVWVILYQLSAAVAYCHDPEKRLTAEEDDEVMNMLRGPPLSIIAILSRKMVCDVHANYLSSG